MPIGATNYQGALPVGGGATSQPTNWLMQLFGNRPAPGAMGGGGGTGDARANAAMAELFGLPGSGSSNRPAIMPPGGFPGSGGFVPAVMPGGPQGMPGAFNPGGFGMNFPALGGGGMPGALASGGFGGGVMRTPEAAFGAPGGRFNSPVQGNFGGGPIPFGPLPPQRGPLPVPAPRPTPGPAPGPVVGGGRPLLPPTRSTPFPQLSRDQNRRLATQSMHGGGYEAGGGLKPMGARLYSQYKG